jgi:hypothetical protein
MDDPFVDPPFVLTILWHPDFKEGEDLARCLYNRFRGEAFQGLNRGTGIQVAFRSASARGGDAPLPIPLKLDRCQAVVLLVDHHFQQASLGPWKSYLDGLVREMGKLKRASLLYPVALEKDVFSINPDLLSTHFIRCYEWKLSPEAIRDRLASELTHEFCRLIVPWVTAIEHEGVIPPVVAQSPEPLKVFISHSKQDGEPLALEVRKIIGETRMKTFFDVYDIPPGWGFKEVLQGEIHRSGLLVIQTDSYASREFCRMEVLTARQFRVPVVVLNAVNDREPRAFPYGGNVPVIMGRDLSGNRLQLAIDTLLDEFLKHSVWHLHGPYFEQIAPGTLMIPHAPDLLTLVFEDTYPAVVVHPGPPLGEVESEILQRLVPGVQLKTPTMLYTEDRPS